MTGRSRALVTVVLVAFLATFSGCSEPPAPSDSVVEIRSDNETQDFEAPARASTGKLGHIVGHILDRALFPIENASATLVSLDLVDRGDRTGQFEFTDLATGAYILEFMAPGYINASAVIQVKADRFTNVRVLLDPVPAEEPYVDLVKWSYHASYTQPEFGVVRFVSSYEIFAGPTPESLSDVVLEAFLRPNPVGTNGFGIGVGPNALNPDWYAKDASPLWLRLPMDAFDMPDTKVGFWVWSSPVPEVGQEAEFILSLFHHQEAPPGYTIA